MNGHRRALCALTMLAISAVAPAPVAAQHAVLDSLARRALDYAAVQLRRSADSLEPEQGYPQSTRPDGSWVLSNVRGWTSGFFAGELWYMYERTHDPYWRDQARRWTAGLEAVKDLTTTHDLGFMVFDSFGQEYRLTRDPHAKAVVLEAAAHLATRFNDKVGATQSWNTTTRGRRASWKFPVIVDNLMNLELLFWAGAHGGDPVWRQMAERHAVTSLHAHVRPDGSTAHVALFDPETGALLGTTTWQGYSDSSVWARGQAWAIYGLTNAYRETHRPDLLQGAQRVADWFIAHAPPDGVPYWDFRAPDIPHTERDASAAAIAASGLLQLADVAPGVAAARYRAAAVHILTTLCTGYLTTGTPSAAILLHGVGAKPQHTQVDVGLVYADYYFIEALMRYLHETTA